jgi:hypothetical protein
VQALRARACALSQIALLYRSNAQSRVLEHALFSRRHALPRLRRAALLRARRRSSTRSPICAWSRTPDDDGAFLRVVNFPTRGIGARTLEQLQDMYVALTRARRHLYLTFAQSRMLHGQTRLGIESRFLKEIPAALTRRIGRAVRPAAGLYGGLRQSGRAVPAASAGDSGMPWRIGQSVVHAKFGAGVIVGAEGRGADARVQVNFRNSGLKWLVLEYARLEPAR